jgi:hypothetical protein
MTMITMILKGMEDLIPIAWVAILFGSLNIICMTLLHSVNTDTLRRILCCVRRMTLFIFTHAVMRASMDPGSRNVADSSDKIILFLKGFTILCALTLIPKGVTDEDDGEAFSSQITYAYATNMGGFFDPLRSSRLFTLVTFMFILASPQIHTQVGRGTKISSTISTNFLQAFDLVVFDAFTSQAFIDSGDSFCDLSIILGCFSILWNFQSLSSTMEGVQQFTTWRTAAFISKIMTSVNVDGLQISILMSLMIIAHSEFSGVNSIIDGTPWVPDLLFLVALNGIIQDTQRYISTIGTMDGIPITFGLVLVITILNESVSHYALKAKRSTSVQ